MGKSWAINPHLNPGTILLIHFRSKDAASGSSGKKVWMEFGLDERDPNPRLVDQEYVNRIVFDTFTNNMEEV